MELSYATGRNERIYNSSQVVYFNLGRVSDIVLFVAVPPRWSFIFEDPAAKEP